MSHTLDTLTQIAHGLAVHFGESCEIAIHDVRHGLENTIVYIENGHITHRKSGDGASNAVLEALKTDTSELHDQPPYLTQTKDGRLLKSSTLYIKDEDGNLEYIFSINYDITVLSAADRLIQSLMQTHQEQNRQHSHDSTESSPTPITHNVTELLDHLIEQALAQIGKPVALMTKDDKIKIVQYLNNAGAFLITKSGDKVASLLEISKFTLYNYMDNKHK